MSICQYLTGFGLELQGRIESLQAVMNDFGRNPLEKKIEIYSTNLVDSCFNSPAPNLQNWHDNICVQNMSNTILRIYTILHTD